MRYRRAFVPGGTFFFTVNLADRSQRLLTEHVDVLRFAFRRVKKRHPFEISAMVVLPEHLHAIWVLPEGDADFSLRWRQIKGTFSRLLPEQDWVSQSKRDRRERTIWQRRFWEHQIRDERDFAQHVDYVHINPVKHGHVRRAADWPHSSIHKYIRAGVMSADWACDPGEGTFGERLM
ncbi:transposase [Pseudomonas taiwanensis]|uniref:REP-associated tyrosine transposase n=1 Tax=Pseudomonas taiwanensis TaxID=470150 RepID=UPI0015BDD1A0|nr:transposase [Pseudomonas taiwanensis]NWL80625.1 transposase [Pseudomonas taiwanensis]